MSKRNLIVILTLATGLIHLALGIADMAGDDPSNLAIPFVLNGLAYIILLVGLYFVPQLQPQRAFLRYALVGLAAVTIVLYFVFQGGDAFNSIPGLVTKAIEVALIALVVTES
jgi:hypothetical protein